MPVIFFNTPSFSLRDTFKPSQVKNLRLLLWAGDGMHGGLSDVRRLPGYDVYLCAGWQQTFQENIDDLNENQTLCVLDIHCEQQLALFHYVYDGCFAQIDSDYNGNTPSLPIANYMSLLQCGGVAQNIEGINGLIMPEENLYGMLELFAPILSPELDNQRRWCWSIMELAKRDDLHPAMVWSSPDLEHPYYAYVKERQKRFEDEQRRRNPTWPQRCQTLAEQWSRSSEKLLLTSLRQHMPSGVAAAEAVLPHLSRFDEFLTQKIAEFLAIKTRFNIVHMDYMNEQNNMGDDILSIVSFKQTILRMIMTGVPDGMRAVIESYPDERYPQVRRAYGLRLRKEPVLQA